MKQIKNTTPNEEVSNSSSAFKGCNSCHIFQTMNRTIAAYHKLTLELKTQKEVYDKLNLDLQAQMFKGLIAAENINSN